VELRRLATAFARGCTLGTLAYALCLWVLVAGNLLFDGSFARAPVETVVALMAAAVYLIVTGAVFGLATGLLAVGRAMVGKWAVLPALAVPAGVALALWCGADMLAARAQAVLDAVVVAAAERDWLIHDLGQVEHAGPVALVIVMPLLFLEFGAILVDPGVLGVLGLLVLALAGVVIAGGVPATVVSLGVVLAAYVRGLLGRWRMWAKIQV
jgi:hypothetical protein